MATQLLYLSDQGISRSAKSLRTEVNDRFSWNKDLVYRISGAMAGEFKKKGVHVALAPSIGPLGRLVTGGRNWEGKSNS